MKVIVEFDSLEQATIAVRAALGEPTASETPAAKAPKGSKASSGAKAASEPQQAVPATPATPATQPSPSTPASAAAPATASTGGVSYDDVKALVLSSPREKVVPVLQKFGAAKAPDLKPEQYADFIAALKGTTEEALV